MSCNLIDLKAGTVLQIEGTLDAVSARELAPLIVTLMTGAQPVIVIDLSALRLIDRAGAGVLVSLCKEVRAQGREVRAVGLRRQPLALFQLLRLDLYLCSPAQSEPAAVTA